MNRRPIINTRDEPHADSSKYRRFHVIIGDSNMSEFATALKIGTTALVLDLIETGKAPQLELANPIEATKAISRDQTYTWIIELQGRPQDFRHRHSAAVPRRRAARIATARTSETAWILREWGAMLDDSARRT